jgi:hypothetical protein
MPEDGEPGGAITGAGVVIVQYAPVIQRKVGLCHHMTSLMTSAQAVLAGGTLISCPAPCTDNRSCRLADREGIGEGLKRHHPGRRSRHPLGTTPQARGGQVQRRRSRCEAELGEPIGSASW